MHVACVPLLSRDQSRTISYAQKQSVQSVTITLIRMGVTHVRWALCVHLPLVLLVLLLFFLFFDGTITVPAYEEVWS